MSRTPDPAKVLLREQIAKKIAELSPEEKKRQSNIVYNKIINHPYYKSAQRMTIFMSTSDEVDTGPIIAHIKARGAAAFVPQYAGGVMRMLRLETGDEENMPLTRHGIAQHSKDQKREDALDNGIDLIIAPGVAFSRDGGRVGHGGGYYDKYIASLRANPQTAPKQSCFTGETSKMVVHMQPGARHSASLPPVTGQYHTMDLVVAVAFNCQVVDKVPMNNLDQKIDDVVFADD